MLAPMTAVAAANPDAWFPVARSAEDIVTVRPDNRMVGYPYTKYMVAVMDVDMAAALLVATHERADALGVPADRRVYLRGWCYATDPVLVAEHPDMWRSPAMAARERPRRSRAPASASTTSPTSISTRASASSLHFACDALGIAPTDPRGLTVTGGLPYHGGPASGYLTHSIAAMVERAARRPRRVRPGQRRRHAHDQARLRRVLDRARARWRRPTSRVQRTLDAIAECRSSAEHDGAATVAAYSVVHGRDGAPESAVLVCDTRPAAPGRMPGSTTPDRVAAPEGHELVGSPVALTPERRSPGPMGSTHRVQLGGRVD